MSVTYCELGVLFDLDGTLVDSSPDLIDALNLALQEHEFEACEIPVIRHEISQGAYAMVKAHFNHRKIVNVHEAILRQIQQRMLYHYQRNNGQRTHPFSGIEYLLNWLDEHQIPWGIITNKEARFSRPLIDKLNWQPRVGTVISGDTCTKAKPFSEPMFLAAQHIQRQPKNIFYLGDAPRDIEAANNSGMISVAVTWGFHKPSDQIDTWPAHHFINSPQQLIQIITKQKINK